MRRRAIWIALGAVLGLAAVGVLWPRPALSQLKSHFRVQVVQQSSERFAPLVIVIPEVHSGSDGEKVRELVEDLDRTVGIDVVAVEGHIGPPGSSVAMEAAAKVSHEIGIPAESILSHVGDLRHHWVFRGRWRTVCLESGDPRSFLDAAILSDYCGQVDSLRRQVGLRGLAKVENSEQLRTILRYFNTRGYGLPIAPERAGKSLFFTADDRHWFEANEVAFRRVLPEVTFKRRNQSFARVLAATLAEGRPKVLVVIVGSAHVHEDHDTPQAFRGLRMLPELVAEAAPDSSVVWIDRLGASR